jgi:predicted transcriptional regulator
MQALNELVRAGHAEKEGESYRITQAGQGRYVTDDNCKGW